MWRIREGYKTPVVRRWLSDDATAIDQRLLLHATFSPESVGHSGTLIGRKSLMLRERSYPYGVATGEGRQWQLVPSQGRHPQDVEHFLRAVGFASR